jgi:hypothetical protein
MLFPTILSSFIYALLLLGVEGVEAHTPRLKQTTRRQIIQRANLHLRPRQATTSSTLFPTCPESQTLASTPYATFSKVPYFDTDSYFVCTSYRRSADDHRYFQLRRLLMQVYVQVNAIRTTVGSAAGARDESLYQDCVAAALHNGQCFLYNQQPSSLKDDGGYHALIKGGCSSVPQGLGESPSSEGFEC